MGNIFEVEKVEKQAPVEVSSSRAIAEVEGQVVMAKKFPRDPVKAMDRILAECRRETLAEQAQYSFPRGGTTVTGESIRLAETIARNWGNISYGITEVERKGAESLMLAYAWDLETNVMARQEFRVRHLRDTKEGLKPLRDERDVYEITANQGARRLRSCILRIIPGDVIDAAREECEKTLQAKVGNVQERLPGMLEKFDGMGVSKTMIERRLRHRIDSMNGPELLSLIKIYNSIKDGMATPDDYFEPDQKEAAKDQKQEGPAEVASAMAEKLKANIKSSPTDVTNYEGMDAPLKNEEPPATKNNTKVKLGRSDVSNFPGVQKEEPSPLADDELPIF